MSVCYVYIYATISLRMPEKPIGRLLRSYMITFSGEQCSVNDTGNIHTWSRNVPLTIECQFLVYSEPIESRLNATGFSYHPCCCLTETGEEVSMFTSWFTDLHMTRINTDCDSICYAMSAEGTIIYSIYN